MFICANPQGQSAGVNRRTRQYNDQKKKDRQCNDQRKKDKQWYIKQRTEN